MFKHSIFLFILIFTIFNLIFYSTASDGFSEAVVYADEILNNKILIPYMPSIVLEGPPAVSMPSPELKDYNKEVIPEKPEDKRYAEYIWLDDNIAVCIE